MIWYVIGGAAVVCLGSAAALAWLMWHENTEMQKRELDEFNLGIYHLIEEERKRHAND